MHHFRKLALEDRDLFEQTISKFPLYQGYFASELNFLNLLAWSKDECIEIMWKEGIGYIRCLKHEDLWFFPPVVSSNEDFTKGVYFIKTRFPNARLIGITEEMKALIPFENALFLVDDKLSEYLYDPKAFIELKGHAFHRKRNLIAQFKKKFNYEFRPYQKEDHDNVIEFINRYISYGGATDDLDALYKALDFINLGLNYISYLLLVDDQVIGISISIITSSNIGIVQFEKADTTYIGSYQMLAHQTAVHAFSNVKFINRQEDLGLPELRHAKNSYHPYIKDLKYAVIFRLFTKRAYELYQLSFVEDSKPYRDYFFLHHYKEEMMRYTYEDDIMKSAFHIKMNSYRIKGKTIEIPMIVAASTHPDYRRRGYMKMLLLNFIRECEQREVPWIILKTDKPDVYAGLGFTGVGHEERVGDYDILEHCSIEQTSNMSILLDIYELRFGHYSHDLRTLAYYQDFVYALQMDGYEAYLIKHEGKTIGYVIQNDLHDVEEMVLLKKVNPIVQGQDFKNVYVPSEVGRPSHMIRLIDLHEVIKHVKKKEHDVINLSVDGHLVRKIPARIKLYEDMIQDTHDPATHLIDRIDLTDILFNGKPHELIDLVFDPLTATFINKY